jgi:ABC-type lipoprotein release transport system permease subunit
VSGRFREDHAFVRDTGGFFRAQHRRTLALLKRREMVVRFLLDIGHTGLRSVTLYPLRSLVIVLALLAALVPYLVGIGLAKGVEAEAEAALLRSPDLYVHGSQFGRTVPVPLSAMDDLGRMSGVERVVPRIVGEVFLGKDQVRCVLVGMPVEHFPSWASCVEGRLPGQGGSHQLVIGTTLARKLGLKIGSRLPPFYRNDRVGERTSEIVGMFKPEAPLWQANLILTTFETAAAVFDQISLATDLLVTCKNGAAAEVRRGIEEGPSFQNADRRNSLRLEVTSSEDLLLLLPRGIRHREGVFSMHLVLASVVAILVLLVSSGLGMSERRREIAILKATGWQTDEILLRSFVESLVLSLTGACLALLLAWLWLRGLNAYGIASAFLDGVDAKPDFPLPYRLTPVPLLLGLVLSLAIVLSGTLYSAWRSASKSPRDAMR